MRRHAESTMTDVCTISRPGDGDPVLDDETGEYIYPDPVTVYTGRCRMQMSELTGPIVSDDSGPERTGIAQVLMLFLPVGTSTGVRTSDTAEVTACRYDPDLVGRKFRITGLHHKSHATQRRLLVEEITG